MAINWKRRLINKLSPINFTNDIEKIRNTFENLCKDFEEYEEIEVDKENLNLTIKLPYNPMGITYGVSVYNRKIDVYIGNPYNPIGGYNLDGLDKGYYDFGIDQTEHKCLNETIDYEEIINKLMERAIQY